MNKEEQRYNYISRVECRKVLSDIFSKIGFFTEINCFAKYLYVQKKWFSSAN